jgi:hypothetical protein
MTGGRPVDAEGARRAAAAALRSGMAGDERIRLEGRPAEPLAISAPDGTPGGWLVGIEVDGSPLGFVQLDAACRFRRYASFPQSPGGALSPPAGASWFDPDAVLARARAVAGPDAHLEAPRLTWDASPDRIVWSVRATPNRGNATTIMVAGELAWPATEEKG